LEGITWFTVAAPVHSHSLDRGARLTFKKANSGDIALDSYGEWLYDGLIVFAPTTDGTLHCR